MIGLDFSICAIVLLIIILLVFYMKKKLPLDQNRYFVLMAWTHLAAVSADVVLFL